MSPPINLAAFAPPRQRLAKEKFFQSTVRLPLQCFADNRCQTPPNASGTAHTPRFGQRKPFLRKKQLPFFCDFSVWAGRHFRGENRRRKLLEVTNNSVRYLSTVCPKPIKFITKTLPHDKMIVGIEPVFFRPLFTGEITQNTTGSCTIEGNYTRLTFNRKLINEAHEFLSNQNGIGNGDASITVDIGSLLLIGV